MPKMTIYFLLFNPFPFYLHTHTVLYLFYVCSVERAHAWLIQFTFALNEILFTATFWRVPAAAAAVGAVKKDQEKAASLF
jgi:hypothetical protein